MRSTGLLASITALEAIVIVLLGQVALIGADTTEEANATLAELRAHCEQVRETLLSMAGPRERFDTRAFDAGFSRELELIFGAIRFSSTSEQ